MGKVILAFVIGITVAVVGSWGWARFQWQQFQRQIKPQEESKVVVYPVPGEKLSVAPEAIKMTFPTAVDTFEIDIRKEFVVILKSDTPLPHISPDRLTVTQPFPATSAGTGTFTVRYKGCPQNIVPTACFSGNFNFTIE